MVPDSLIRRLTPESSFFKRNRTVIRFLVRLVTALLIYFVLITLIKSNPAWDRYFKTSGPVYALSAASAHTTREALNLSGYEAEVHYSYAYTDVIGQGVFVVNIPGSDGIWIGGHCLGLKLLGIFVILIAAFPGRLRRKIWFIAGGITLIEAIYIWRLAYLVVVSKKVAESGADFNMAAFSGQVHDYLNLGLYALIIILFFIYARFIA